jgi:hypothetical protein
VFAGAMLCLWPLGMPLLGIFLLLRNNKAIKRYLALYEELEIDDGTQKIFTLKEAPKQIKMFKGLFENFRADYYWWGILDMFYGLLLTGFAVLFAPGSMMQISLAFLIGLGYYVLQLSCKPYRNSYHNFMVALVNLNVTLTIFGSLLLKVDNEMGAALAYEAGYNIESIAIFLILCNVIIVFEFVGYTKRAVELATAVVIVATSKSDLAKGAEEAAKAGAAATEPSTTEENDDEAVDSVCLTMAKKIESAVKEAFKNVTTCGEKKKKKEKKDSVDPALIVEGFYFPRVLNGHVWGPFPHTNTYREIYNLLLWCSHCVYVCMRCSSWNFYQTCSDSEGADANVESDDEGANHSEDASLKTKNIPKAVDPDASLKTKNIPKAVDPGVTSRSLFWDVTVYVNDTSGWVLRRTSLGWEIAPNLSSEAQYVAKGATTYPPKSGWETVESASSNISSVSVPFRWQGRSMMPTPELECGLEDLSSSFSSSTFVNPGVANTQRGSLDDGALPRASSIELAQL